MTVDEAFNLAAQHHQAGQLTESETLCRQILAVQPDHANAMHLLGILAHQTERSELAAELIGGAVRIQPVADFYLNLGLVLYALKRLD